MIKYQSRSKLIEEIIKIDDKIMQKRSHLITFKLTICIELNAFNRQ